MRSKWTTQAWLPVGLFVILLWGASPPVQAVAPLTPAQVNQLATATDFSEQFDEAALYPLLENIVWLDAQDKGGSINPDYAALLNSPANFRGQLFLVDGLLAAPPRQVERLIQPGPWDDSLQQWVIQVDPAHDRVAVVFLVDPPAEGSRPRVGSRVQIVARFYKVWNQKRVGDSKLVSFPTFVGKSVYTSSTGPTPAPVSPFTTSGSWVLIPIVILAMGIAFIFLRAKLLGLPSARERFERRREPRREEGWRDSSGVEDTAQPPLPKDPAEALSELQRRGGEAASDQTSGGKTL